MSRKTRRQLVRWILSLNLITTIAASTITPLSPTLKQQLIQHQIWHAGCPVPLHQLRLLSIDYYDLQGRPHRQGQLILAESAAKAAALAFDSLHQQHFRFAGFTTLVSLNGQIGAAEKNNLSYGFYCPPDSINDKTLASGTVLSLNPVQNPSVIPSAHFNTIQVSPNAGLLSINRRLQLPGMLEKAVPIFQRYHFEWSGRNPTIMDWKKFYFKQGLKNHGKI